MHFRPAPAAVAFGINTHIAARCVKVLYAAKAKVAAAKNALASSLLQNIQRSNAIGGRFRMSFSPANIIDPAKSLMQGAPACIAYRPAAFSAICSAPSRQAAKSRTCPRRLGEYKIRYSRARGRCIYNDIDNAICRIRRCSDSLYVISALKIYS